jgi:hypothetical protein
MLKGGQNRSFFSSNPCEFLRVGNDANRLHLPLLHINGEDVECFFVSADDQGGLTVDFSWLDTCTSTPSSPSHTFRPRTRNRLWL